MISGKDGLERLRAGNQRFVSGTRRTHSFGDPVRRAELAERQEPFAAIVGCSDSRVPPELVFDQGMGDLFVIRVAGSIVAPSQIGSVEFAVQELGTRLVVVLGHSQCGAVAATLEALRHPPEDISDGLASIVRFVRPSVEPLLDTELAKSPEALLEEAVRANVRSTVARLRTESPVIGRLIQSGELTLIGSEFSLESGIVEFFDPVSGS